VNVASDALDVALLAARAFDATGVAYFLGGSLASSLQGEPRATNDIDFVVDLEERSIDPLVVRFGDEFQVDREVMLDAVRRRATCNIFFLPLVTKIDLFVLKKGAFDASEFARRREVRVRDEQVIVVKSPEDSILRKLLWFVESGEVSDRQWRDVVEILRVSAAALDGGYLDAWAARLGVTEQLTRARAAAAIP
jgi:hypothetical protein